MGDGLGHQDLAVEAAAEVNVAKEDQVVQRLAVGHDDHRGDRIPSSR